MKGWLPRLQGATPTARAARGFEKVPAACGPRGEALGAVSAAWGWVLASAAGAERARGGQKAELLAFRLLDRVRLDLQCQARGFGNSTAWTLGGSWSKNALGVGNGGLM